MDLEPILERAKLHLNIKSDADLARHLARIFHKNG